MIIESMAIQVSHFIFPALTSMERWGSAGQDINAYSAAEGWLTGFAMAALIVSLILVFYLSANHKRSLDDLRRKIDGLTAHIDELQRQIAELDKQAPAKVSGQVSPEESEELAVIRKS